MKRFLFALLISSLSAHIAYGRVYWCYLRVKDSTKAQASDQTTTCDFCAELCGTWSQQETSNLSADAKSRLVCEYWAPHKTLIKFTSAAAIKLKYAAEFENCPSPGNWSEIKEENCNPKTKSFRGLPIKNTDEQEKLALSQWKTKFARLDKNTLVLTADNGKKIEFKNKGGGVDGENSVTFKLTNFWQELNYAVIWEGGYENSTHILVDMKTGQQNNLGAATTIHWSPTGKLFATSYDNEEDGEAFTRVYSCADRSRPCKILYDSDESGVFEKWSCDNKVEFKTTECKCTAAQCACRAKATKPTSSAPK